MTAYLVLVALCFFGPAILAKARRDDRAPYHLMHGPHDDCIECEDK